MRDNQVNAAGGKICWKRNGRDLQRRQPGRSEAAALPEELEHACACVNGKCMHRRCTAQECGEETAIAIAQDERMARMLDLRKEPLAGAGKQAAEQGVLGPPIHASDPVEISFPLAGCGSCFRVPKPVHT